MKQQKEFYAIALDNNNRFLAEYKNDEETEKAMENLAKAVGGRLVKAKAEYEVTEEDGSELKEPKEKEDEKGELDKFLERLLGQ